jgi:Rieske 2Fe-2S family protein
VNMRTRNQTWTDELALGHERISLEDTISPTFFARETEAVFRRSWLYVGRVERVASSGSYFTKEFEPLKASLLVTRDKQDTVRVFHNVCPHRGNKLVWDTHADRETSGRCSRFVCKFHGVAFGPSGDVERLTDKVSWLDDQGQAMHLAEVPSGIWNGFIFVNLTPGGPQQTLREFIGEDYWTGFDYPFGEMTERYAFQANANANWKALMDGFSEIYHAATTHALPFAMPSLDKLPSGAGHFADLAIRGQHRYFLTGRVPRFNFRYEQETDAVATGPRYEFPQEYATLPRMANPIGFSDWGTSSHMFWPNLYIQLYHPGWFLTYLMQPLAHNKMRFELDIYMPKPRNFSQMLGQKSSILQFLEAALQDFSLLEAQQLGLETRAFETYPLTDQEILLRDFHQKIHAAVSAHEIELGRGAAGLAQSSDDY